jgi:hypothetical protein
MESFVRWWSERLPRSAREDDLGRPAEEDAVPPVSKRQKIRYDGSLSDSPSGPNGYACYLSSDEENYSATGPAPIMNEQIHKFLKRINIEPCDSPPPP